MSFTCKDCSDRHLGCHGTCDAYLQEKARLTELNRKIYKEKMAETAFYEHYRDILSGGECGLHNEETKEKMRKSALGHTVSKDVKKILSDSKSIPIICIENNKVYRNCKEAAKDLGVCNTSISRVCTGKASHAGGMHFAKLRDYESDNLPVFKQSTKRNKRIICITTGEVFESETQAAKRYGVTSQAISHACSGKVQTCCGFAWTEAKHPELQDIPSRRELNKVVATTETSIPNR